MAGRLLSLENEIEAERQDASDFVFCRIGEPVPLKPTLPNSVFDLSHPPLQPLAVSELHRLLFIAHSEGFLVASTKDVIGLAKNMQDRMDTCIQRSCIVDVQIGRVSILSLSGDSSMLAATVGGDIHLFHVQSLLNKVQEPAFIAALNKSGIVKDLKWRKNSENSFVVLSSHGSLSQGFSDFQLKDVIDNVDSVDWSVDGNLVAVARRGIVSILSSSFEEILDMQLLFGSWTDDSVSEIKVDSIKWVRHDSIVVGYTLLKNGSGDGEYLVQVITSGEHKFTEASCKPLVFSFPDLFEQFSVDMLPTRAGPCLHSEYLDFWNVAITSTKMKVDQHISLLQWLVGDNGLEVVSLELGDTYVPRIDLQDDGDDNFILGLAVDKISLYDKIRIRRGAEYKEFSPRCILLCLTYDGKLVLYHTAWVSEPSDFPILSSTHNGITVNPGYRSAISAKIHSCPDKSNLDAGGKMESHGTSDGVGPSSHPIPDIEKPNILFKTGDLDTSLTIYDKSSDSSSVKGSNTGKSSSLTGSVGSFCDSQIGPKAFGVNGSNNTPALSTTKATVASTSLGSTINEGHSSGLQTSKPFSIDASKTKIALSSFGQSNSGGIVNEVPLSPSVLKSSSVAVSSKLPGSRQQNISANSTLFKPLQILESEPPFPKQFFSVKEVTKELDARLSSIECEGGFLDFCTVYQEQSVLDLETGLDNLSEVLFLQKNKLEKLLMDIQLLRNKMLEVSARQVNMEVIVQQASDNGYWELWNTQKLSPEFEAKRLHISNLKQNLTNQLVELERHFNSLEVNMFGDHNGVPIGCRSPCRNSMASRPTQSFHSVYSTVNSQLSAAVQLSEYLSKQMAVLNITSPTSEKRNITRELFESIGLDPRTDASMPPGLDSSNLVQYSSKRSSLSSSSISEHSSKISPTLKTFASARRNRDSLDKRWAHFEPPRTTIKRTSKEEQVKSNKGIIFREAKATFDSQVKAFDIARTSKNVVSSASSESFGITKRTSTGAASSLSTTTSFSQPVEHSASKGMQEKNYKQATDGHYKSDFNRAKPLDIHSESFQSVTAQTSLFSAPAFHSSSSSKDEKSVFSSMFNMVTSSEGNQSSVVMTKPALVSKPATVSTQQKSNFVLPSKAASAAEKRSQLNQEAGLKHEVDSLPNLAPASPLLPSSSLPSSHFEKSMVPNNSLPQSKISTPPSFSNELAFKPGPFLPGLHASEGLRSSNELAASVKELDSKPKTDTSQIPVSPKQEVGAEIKYTNESKTQQIALQTPRTCVAPSTLPSVTNKNVVPVVSDFQPKAISASTMPSSIITAEKDQPLDDNLSQEDEMEEEDMDTNSMLNLESLGGFSLQPTPSSNHLKPNPFGGSFVPANTGSASSLLSWNSSPGQLFRPPSFNIPESQPQQSASTSSLTGVVSGAFRGFGQPAQLGAGQQALGSVLGTFGQSRQLGAGMPGFGFASSGVPAAVSTGGLANTGGFAGAATGSGFSGLAPNSGGFAGAASGGGGFAGAASGGGGFAGAASGGGGFAGAASGGGGFAGVASVGGGFAGAGSAGGGFGGINSSGGFGGFSNVQGSGFSGFGAGSSGSGRPPADLLTKMRK